VTHSYLSHTRSLLLDCVSGAWVVLLLTRYSVFILRLSVSLSLLALCLHSCVCVCVVVTPTRCARDFASCESHRYSLFCFHARALSLSLVDGGWWMLHSSLSLFSLSLSLVEDIHSPNWEHTHTHTHSLSLSLLSSSSSSSAVAAETRVTQRGWRKSEVTIDWFCKSASYVMLMRVQEATSKTPKSPLSTD
jgi:hypothetical protein